MNNIATGKMLQENLSLTHQIQKKWFNWISGGYKPGGFVNPDED
jgi:hypothetical protein